jgi:polyphenol oxidase
MEPPARPLRGLVAVAGGTAGWAFTTAEDGDLAATVTDDDRHHIEQSVVPRRWVMAHQVHGADVLTLTGDVPLPSVAAPGAIVSVNADAIVTDHRRVAVAVRTGDCAPVLLVGDGPVVAAVHAGWRGLVAGVIEAAVQAMGVPVTRAFLGPCIWPCCYAFGAVELATVEERCGATVRARTGEGAMALDVPAAVDAALALAGAPAAERVGACTGCGQPPMFSHRVRRESGRQAGVVWIDGGP